MSKSGKPEATKPQSMGFLTRPSSVLGRVSVIFFIIAIVLILLNASVIDSLSLNGGISSGVSNTLGVMLGICVLTAGISGLIAIVFKRERSWAVFVTTVMPLVVLGNEILQFLLFRSTGE
ncbi:MAG: hypothetical protein NTW32_22605 [Chloroflexi bacterium]|nr:hypothetical protein [Chloroflexota bacterium]